MLCVQCSEEVKTNLTDKVRLGTGMKEVKVWVGIFVSSRWKTSGKVLRQEHTGAVIDSKEADRTGNG
jgi:hypothetical protein